MSKLHGFVEKLAHEANKLEIIAMYSDEVTADKVSEVEYRLRELSVELDNLADEWEGEKENGKHEQNPQI